VVLRRSVSLVPFKRPRVDISPVRIWRGKKQVNTYYTAFESASAKLRSCSINSDSNTLICFFFQPRLDGRLGSMPGMHPGSGASSSSPVGELIYRRAVQVMENLWRMSRNSKGSSRVSEPKNRHRLTYIRSMLRNSREHRTTDLVIVSSLSRESLISSRIR